MNRDVKWISQYIELLRASREEEFFDLKYKNFPKRFYKFRKLDKNTIKCLDENYLHIAKPRDLNDPFECSLILDHVKIAKSFYTGEYFKCKIKKLYNYDFPLEILNRIENSVSPFNEIKAHLNSVGLNIDEIPAEEFMKSSLEWNELMNEFDTQIRICSFGTANDSKLMWSHYADSHKGICIEYDFNQSHIIKPFIHPVLYSNARTSINAISQIEVISKIIASISKSEDWQYEEEWRFVAFSTEVVNALKDKLPVPTPTAIYLGVDFESNDEKSKSNLINLAKARNIKIIKMKYSDNGFNLFSN